MVECRSFMVRFFFFFSGRFVMMVDNGVDERWEKVNWLMMWFDMVGLILIVGICFWGVGGGEERDELDVVIDFFWGEVGIDGVVWGVRVLLDEIGCSCLVGFNCVVGDFVNIEVMCFEMLVLKGLKECIIGLFFLFGFFLLLFGLFMLLLKFVVVFVCMFILMWGMGGWFIGGNVFVLFLKIWILVFWVFLLLFFGLRGRRVCRCCEFVRFWGVGLIGEEICVVLCKGDDCNNVVFWCWDCGELF